MKKIMIIMAAVTLLAACNCKLVACNCKDKYSKKETQNEDFKFVIDRFGDIEIMAYQVDDWESLTLQQKELVYYLSEAARCGRDILFDQNCRFNLAIKVVLENIVEHYQGDRNSEDWKNFMVYVKRFWFSNGIHHHYSNEKFYPELSRRNFTAMMKSLNYSGKEISNIAKMIYNPNIAPKRMVSIGDLVANSSVNFYEGVTQKEVETFYDAYLQANPQEPVSVGLNSKVVKQNGAITEEVYKSGGLYGAAIDKIIYWLEKAMSVAENDQQKAHITKLIEYYQTGDLKTWDDYNVLWVKDNQSLVDYVNGFIEVYTDPIGRKATWESVVNYKDVKNSKRSEIIAGNAQWFEDHSPIAPEYKKKEVKGVSAKVITVAQLGGDCYPATPIGINLPNANWIRKEHGSKSVTMENIMYAYSQARMGNGTVEEFYLPEEAEIIKKYGYQAENLLIDMHECLGHGSGQMLPGVDDGKLKNYHSAIEETRADLFALYYLGDSKMIELGLLENEDAMKAGYYKNILNGYMLQLNRIDLGKEITQAHMKNRAIISNWLLEKGIQNQTMEIIKKDNKTFLKINDYNRLRVLVGELLAIIQDIKSRGDYEGAKKMVETYGVKINPELHKEVKERFEKLDIAPYGGFVNPEFTVIKEGDKITDIQIDYQFDYEKQMMNYAKKYSFLK